jgi:hypothetical protein
MATNNLFAQETYSVEAGFSSNNNSGDDSYSEKVMGFGATYYLKPIAIDKSQPFAELDFLQKASNVGVIYANDKYSSSSYTDTTINPLNFFGTFYVDNFSFGISNTSWGSTNFITKANTAQYVGTKLTNTTLSGGYFVLPTTLLSYVNSQTTGTYSVSSGLSAITDKKITKNGVKSHTVNSLGENQSIVVDLSYSQIKTQQTSSQTNNEYGFNVRYYPLTKYYVEGSYSVNSGDVVAAKGNTYGVGAGYQVTPRFGFFLSTSKFTVSNATQLTSSKNTTLTAGYRF